MVKIKKHIILAFSQAQKTPFLRDWFSFCTLQINNLLLFAIYKHSIGFAKVYIFDSAHLLKNILQIVLNKL